MGNRTAVLATLVIAVAIPEDAARTACLRNWRS